MHHGVSPFALAIVTMLASCGGAERDNAERSMPVPLPNPPSGGGALDVREFLERARLLDKAGVREHRDALRAYQTAARLMVDGFEVYAGEGDRGKALLQIWMESLKVAYRHWSLHKSATLPPSSDEVVEIILPRGAGQQDLVFNVALAIREDILQEDRGPGKAASLELQVPLSRLRRIATMVCVLDMSTITRERAAAVAAAAAAAANASCIRGCGTMKRSGEECPDNIRGCSIDCDDRREDADESSTEECTQNILTQLEHHYTVLAERSLAARPPRQIPDELWDEFTDGGRTVVLDWYDDASDSTYYAAWPVPHLSAMQHMVSQRTPGINYPSVDAYLYEYLDNLGGRDHFSSSSVVIMGSAVPWYEALALEYGAAQTLTIEYNRVHYGDVRMKAMQPADYWAMPPGVRPRFDIGMSISSFEHDGLGRYGDPVNPTGDLEAMAEMEAIISDGGLLLLAVPVAAEALVWNVHRIYGRNRLSRLLERWTIEHHLGMHEDIFEQKVYAPSQPLFVLRNTRPTQPHVF